MKNIITIITLTLLSAMLSAQTSKSSSSSTTSSSNLSISVHSDDDDYSYTAKFDGEKTKIAQNAIIKNLGEPTEKTDRTAIWEGKGYSVSVRPGKIEMEMDFEKVTKSFRLKFEDMGDQISEALGSPKAPVPPKTPKK